MWIKRFRVPFQSFGGTQYMLYIYEQGSSQGDVITLTGAPETFTTQEDDTSDIFTPIRGQSGYLRIIDDSNGTLLPQLMPANNTDRMVRLYTGTWNSDFTTFTDGSIKWQGFLSAEAYTQKWGESVRMLELPVKSYLSALQNVYIDATEGLEYNIVADLVVRAFEKLTGGSDAYANVKVIDDTEFLAGWLQTYIYNGLFFTENSVETVWNNYTELIGKSYYDILSTTLQLFGLCAREDGDTLIFSHYDKAGFYINIYDTTYSEFSRIAGGGQPLVTVGTAITDAELMNNVSFRGMDNSQSYEQGAKEAVVSLDIQRNGNSFFHIPACPEQDMLPPIEVPLYDYDEQSSATSLSDYNLYITANVLSGDATYAFYQYSVDYNITTPHVIGYSYTGVGSRGDFYSDIMNMNSLDRPRGLTGALLCKWQKATAHDYHTLQNGLVVMTKSAASVNIADVMTYTGTPRSIFTIGTNYPWHAQNGYLVFEADIMQLLYQGIMGNTAQYVEEFGEIYLCCKLKIGQKWLGYYKNSEDQHSIEYNWYNSDDYFFIPFDKNGKIISNKKDTWQVNSNGLIIPIDDTITGTIEFSILDVTAQHDFGWKSSSQDAKIGEFLPIIISKFEMLFVYSDDVLANQRDSNKYRRQILSMGFSDSREIGLTVGTYNNNLDSQSFICDDAGNYVEEIEYLTGALTTIQARPEMHLLNRMTQHYSAPRMSFSTIIQAGLDIITKRYTYLGKTFFGVCASRDWNEDKANIKFIEVS